jgi:hypothetical protein
METLTEEVVSESSQNTVESQTQGEGNLSMAEFADQLLKRRQPEEEVTEPTEEVDEPAEETAEPTNTLEEEINQSAEEEVEEEEDSSPPAESSENVLSKFNIDLDNLSEEESRDLAKALNASAVKRFGRLTAQKKALLAENAELQAQAEQAQEQAQQSQSAELPEYLKDNALHNISDEQSLKKEVENLTSLVEWADENLDNEVQYDDDGNEYVAKDGDKVYTKADLRRIKANANKILRKDAPARHAWLQQRANADQQALQTFEFLGDENSEDYQQFMQLKSDRSLQPILNYIPNSNFALGLIVEGIKAVKARDAQKAAPKPKPKAPTASTEAGTARPKTPQANAQKALQAAKAKFDKSGSMADYQAYLKLKNKS